MPEPINAAHAGTRQSARALLLKFKKIVSCVARAIPPPDIVVAQAPAHAGGGATESLSITRGVTGYGEVEAVYDDHGEDSQWDIASQQVIFFQVSLTTRARPGNLRHAPSFPLRSFQNPET
ncbi:hypothetical protein GGQ61_002986 [Phenylobacterium haematophilum]|uniref:Uncharacterized protein n=1 Tax=Phenylobacterium haematophilum TaxID=98513 RepID=A0A840A3K5_9CAUL|nr:hypothetical protein [Phenylobacterium haematophilum]MBB3892253.1 hypothetical protein [Phenylobacterium haematophilum]